MLARALTPGSVPILVFSLVRWAKHVLEDPAFRNARVNMNLNCERGESKEEDYADLFNRCLI